MNRAERRAAAKAKPQRVLNRRVAAMAFNTAMAKALTTQNTQSDLDELLKAPYAELENLRIGSLDDEGFVRLNEANIAAFCLASLVHVNGTEATRQMIAPTAPVFALAANSLADLGTRRAEKGRYVARAEEIQAIRESYDWYRWMLEFAPQGLVTQALQQATAMCQAQLEKIAKEMA